MSTSTLLVIGRSRVQDRALACAVILLLPFVVLLATPDPLLQNGAIDPYVYSGYIHDYHQLYTYFGETYYSTRISAIDVSRVMASVLGPERGYYVVRYLLLVMASASVFAIGRRFFDSATGALSAILLCFSPWYLRSIAWDYVDGFAITYLFGAVAFLIVPARRIALSHVAAGALFALAVNSNLWSLAIGGVFAPSWLVLHRRDDMRRIVALAAAIVGGFLLAYAGLAIAMHLEFPGRPLFFEAATLRAVNSLMILGGAAEYFKPLVEFLRVRHNYILVPLILWVSTTVLLWRRGRRHATGPDYVMATVLYLGLVILLYVVNHFVLHHGRITLTYYFSYSVVGSFMAVIALVGELAARVRRRHAVIAMSCAVAAYAVAYCGYSPAMNEHGLVWFWAATAVAGVAALVASNRPDVRLGAVLLCLVATPIAFYDSGEDYADLHSSSRAAVEWDVYRGSIDLENVLAAAVAPHPGWIKFWYDPTLPGHVLLNSLQSTYLWGYCRITPMPRIDASFGEKVAGVHYLVILGESEKEIDGALGALSRAGFGHHVIARDEIGGANWSFRLAIVELPQSAAATSVAVRPAHEPITL